MVELRTFKVATYYRPGERLSQITCYTRDYNAAWEGCIIYDVEARSGNEAKKKAKLLRYGREVACGSPGEGEQVKPAVTVKGSVEDDKYRSPSLSVIGIDELDQQRGAWVLTDENLDLLGQAADTADNYLAGTVLALPAEFHVKCLKTGLEEISRRLKGIYRETAGLDPWKDHPPTASERDVEKLKEKQQ